MKTPVKFHDDLYKAGACMPGLQFAKRYTRPVDAWNNCKNWNWMIWGLWRDGTYMNKSPANSAKFRRIIVRLLHETRIKGYTLASFIPCRATGSMIDYLLGTDMTDAVVVERLRNIQPTFISSGLIRRGDTPGYAIGYALDVAEFALKTPISLSDFDDALFYVCSTITAVNCLLKAKNSNKSNDALIADAIREVIANPFAPTR